jgi:hypothetical protein
MSPARPRVAFALLLSPFAIAVACGTRTEPRELAFVDDAGGESSSEVGETATRDAAARDEGTDDAPLSEVGVDTSPGPPVHCGPAVTAPPPSAIATCSAGSNCFMEGHKIVCGPPTGELNCGRVNCSGRCYCGSAADSFCSCV